MRAVFLLVCVLSFSITKAQKNLFYRFGLDTLNLIWAKNILYVNDKIYTFGGNESLSANRVYQSVHQPDGSLVSILGMPNTVYGDTSYYLGKNKSVIYDNNGFFYAIGNNQTYIHTASGVVYKYDTTGNYFIRSVNDNDTANSYRGISYSSDGYIYAFGIKCDSNFIERCKILISKFDQNLNKIWDYSGGGNETNLGSGIFNTKDSGVAFAYSSGQFLHWQGRVAKVSKDGDLVYDKQLPVGIGEVSLMDYDQNNEDIIIKRFQYTTDGINGTELYYLYLTKIDSNMDVVWNKQWYALAYLPTITIVNNIWNSLRVEDGYVFCGDSGGEAWVFKLSSDGSKIWEAKYGYLKGVNYGSYINYYVSGIDTLPDDKGFVISGSTNDTLNRQVAFIMSIDKNGCFSDDTCESKQYVSITYFDAAIRVQVFPNPIQDYLSIKVTNAQLNGAELIITDLLGRTIAKQTLLQELTTFSTQDWANGMYVWSLVEEGRILRSGKLVKE